MIKLHILIIALLLSINAITAQTIDSNASNSTFKNHHKYTFTKPKMGSPFTIVAYGGDSIKLLAVVEKAFSRVDTLNRIFSDYDAQSEISLLCKNYTVGEWYNISDDLYKILIMSLLAANKSKGAYDITVGNIVSLWRKARKEKTFPDKFNLQNALDKTGWRHIELEGKNKRIRFKKVGIRLDFGGIVKGYAAQEAVRILTEAQFPICLADAGGDLALGKAVSSVQKWTVGVGIPNETQQLLSHMLSLENQAVATSGDMYNFVELNGKRYSHIVNPKTGMGLTHQRNVTIIAPDGALADWLATACSVLSIRKSLKLIKQFPNTEILIVENKGNRLKMWQSKGFEHYLKLHTRYP